MDACKVEPYVESTSITINLLILAYWFLVCVLVMVQSMICKPIDVLYHALMDINWIKLQTNVSKL
jgi:hypothetical protein